MEKKRLKKIPEIIEFNGIKLKQDGRSENVVFYHPIYHDNWHYFLVGILVKISHAKMNGKQFEEELLITRSGRKNLIFIHDDFKTAVKDFRSKINKFG